MVATVLTVYGIETRSLQPIGTILSVATVLTVYGIETPIVGSYNSWLILSVATVLTVYGIETYRCFLI